jgi:hypothetical protein
VDGFVIVEGAFGQAAQTVTVCFREVGHGREDRWGCELLHIPTF